MELFDIEDNKEKLKLMVGVSSGLYTIARPPELASVVRKLGFGLTRGTNAIEIAGDVPHEIDFTQGKELRHIAEKQGLTLLLHGSLTVPMAMPERGEWRDAQNHIQKSIRSAVMGGCKYVNFHACLHFWLEMMTYAGRKLTMAFCDHEGKFIDKILKENDKLRKWFIEKKWDIYGGDILDNDERVRAQIEADRKIEEWRRRELAERLRRGLQGLPEEARGNIENIVERILTTGVIPIGLPENIRGALQKIIEDMRSDVAEQGAKDRKKAFQDVIEKKLEKGGKWDSEELRAVVGIIDGYHIIAHYLYYSNDPIWQRMYEMYKDVLESGRYKTVTYFKNGKNYTYSPRGLEGEVDYWLDAAWEKAESENDREFKEFYYAVCAAKYIEGHMSIALKWMKDESPEGLIGGITAEVKDVEEIEKLRKNAKDIRITLEIPDARSPEYAGLYLICRPKQIYAAVKTMLARLNTDKLLMLIDFEHIATQGFDPLNEIRDFVKLAPDAGKYILSLHVTKPTPLHHHIQVEIGDVEVYKLLWELAKVGLGKYHTTYLIFERGGERDPFKQSVTAIRLMVEQLNQGTTPENLIGKPKFFGVAGPTPGSEERQRVIIQEHARDPIEGLLVVPEETYTSLGKAGIAKIGKEKWKKEELR